MPARSGIYYSQYDGGQKEQPPVILLHGAGNNHQIWPAAIRRLAGQRVFAIDLPGHGKSDGVGLQSIAAYADLMIEFLASLGQFQAVFVGHGMGGAIAIEMAIRHPDHTAGIGLVSTGAWLDINPQLQASFSNPVTLNDALYSFQQKAFRHSTPPAQVEQCLQAIKSMRPSVLAADWYASAQFDQRAAITQIKAPAWIIVGAEDRLTPVVHSHFLAGSIPAARLQIIPDAGHMVISEQPERVAQGLQQFLAAMSAARRAATLPVGLTPLRPQVSNPTFRTTGLADLDRKS